MFTNIKIKNIKALKECRLTDLGKINIICGKNNSGKSTVLEGMTYTDNFAYGKSLLGEGAEYIFQNSVLSVSWDKQNGKLNTLYTDILNMAIQSQSIWYSDESNIYVDKVMSIYNNSELSRWIKNDGAIEHAYLSLFSEARTTVLVPPKRMLELNRDIKTGENILPDGSGLLNYLFFAKNQPSNSEDTRVFVRVNEALTNISSGYTFGVFPNKQNTLMLYFSYQNGPWVNAQDCGLGLQDLLVILYFSIQPQYNLIRIEEPESHMHPDMQRRLLFFLKEETDKQFFLSTHSNVFLNYALIDRVFFTSYTGSVTVDDATSRVAVLNDLGYSIADNLTSDLIILVEGPSDTPIIEEILIKLGLLEKYDIKVWPLGGDIMDQLDLTVFAQKYKIIALLDQDPNSGAIRKRFEDKCKELDIPVHRLARYAIENYFPLSVLRDVFKGQIADDIQAIASDKKLELQIGLNVKKNNRKLAQRLEVIDFEDTDLHSFFEQVRRLCIQEKITT